MLINFVVQSLIQPKFLGDAVGLSTTVTFLSLILWTFILGPLGALLAIPLSLLARTLLVDSDPDGDWAAALISGEVPPDGGTAPTFLARSLRPCIASGAPARRWPGGWPASGRRKRPRQGHSRSCPTAASI